MWDYPQNGDVIVQCPACGSPTKVVRTITNDQGLRRDRVCEKQGDRFQTLETPLGWRLEDIYVNGRPARAFDRDYLINDVEKSTRTTTEEARAIVNSTVAALRRTIRTPNVLEPVEHTMPDTGETRVVRAVDVSVIRDAVEDALEEHGRPMLRVLYTMDFEGRTDRKGRQRGWRTARDVLDWLHRTYPDLKPQEDIEGPKAAVYEWAPQRNAGFPSTVLKQPAAADGNRVTEDFSTKKFAQGIRLALDGRPVLSEVAHYVTWMVLTPLEGQSLVTSNQLGTAALDVLRQVDDVAYLRWVTIMKDIDDIEVFHAEARGLVEHPSPRIQFGPIPGKRLDLREVTQ